MPQGLRAGMYGIVLGTCPCFQVLGMIALQAFNNLHAQLGCQIGILPIGLHPPSPPGVPEYIHIGSPEGKSRVLSIVTYLLGDGKLCPRLIGNSCKNTMNQFPVKSGSHANGLGKDRGPAIPCHTMQRFAPPVIFRNSQPFNGSRIIAKLTYLFFDGHFSDQQMKPIFKSDLWIVPGEIVISTFNSLRSGIGCTGT